MPGQNSRLVNHATNSVNPLIGKGLTKKARTKFSVITCLDAFAAYIDKKTIACYYYSV